jgi:dTDP-4-amino-4,6-dideoxygalactose transaminase
VPPRRYDQTTCPATRDLLPRMVHLSVTEAMTPADIDDIATAVRKVAEALAAGENAHG